MFQLHRFAIGFCTAATAALIPLAGFAADARIGVVYRASLGGFPLAKGTLSMVIQGDAYSTQVGLKTTGLGRIAIKSRTNAEAVGWLSGIKISPTRYTMAAITNKKPTNVRMSSGSSGFQKVNAKPRLKKRPDRVPVTGRHRNGTLDPVSAILMPVPRHTKTLSRKACARTLPIFDGWTRYDIKLSYAGMRTVKIKGYKGKVVVCKIRWVPVAGHRPGKGNVKYMQNNRDMKIWLAPVGQLPYLVPLRISIRTKVGQLVVDARKVRVATGRLAQANTE